MKKYLFTMFTLLFMLALNGCGHEHVFTDATCVTPRTCTTCGETEGDALGHSLIDATCDTPQICNRCNFIGQEALGHTTEVGKCERCNLFQGTDIVNNILEKLKYADSITELGFIAQTSDDSANYDSLLSGITYYKSAKVEYESALELCGNYPDLATLKKDIANLIDMLPLNLSGNTREDFLSYQNDLKNFILARAKCQITAITVEDLINID